MAEVAEGLENLVDHVEFEDSDDKHEAPRRSAREKHSTEKGSEYVRNLRLQAVIQQKGLGENKSIPFIRL